MARLIRAVWLLVMWAIAGLAGANIVFALRNDLDALVIIGVLLAVAALGASLIVLSKDFESGFGIEPRNRHVGVQPQATRPPATSSRDRIPNEPLGVIHQAGTPTASTQLCARCGKVLHDFHEHPWEKAWPAGTLIAESNGSLKVLHDTGSEDWKRSLCQPEAPLVGWHVV